MKRNRKKWIKIEKKKIVENTIHEKKNTTIRYQIQKGKDCIHRNQKIQRVKANGEERKQNIRKVSQSDGLERTNQ